MKILFSISYTRSLDVESGPVGKHSITAIPRHSDWGKRGTAKLLYHMWEAIGILRMARRYDAVVLCTAGIEAFFAAKWRRFFCPRTKVIVYDFLMPREARLTGIVRPWLKDLDGFACIRRGDITTLGRRFGIPEEKCRFVPFPANPGLRQTPTSEGDYIYSAGWAHRDWPTLVQALSDLPYRAILSVGAPLDIPEQARDRVEVIPQCSPEQGQSLMANARVVALSFEETDLPSGPLVLLDAMAMGKAIVATNVNGTRDYIEAARTALLVTPRDSAAMAAAIRSLFSQSQHRLQLGKAAKEETATQFTHQNTMALLVDVCRTL